MKKSAVYVLFIVSFCFTSGFVVAQDAQITAMRDKMPVATVKGAGSEEPITVQDLQSDVLLYESGTGQKLSAQKIEELLDGIINQRLALQAAKKDMSEREIDEAVKQEFQNFKLNLQGYLGHPPSNSEIAAFIREQTKTKAPQGVPQGKADDDAINFYKDYLKKQIPLLVYYRKKSEDLKKALAPTEEEIKKEYNLQKGKLKQEHSVRYSALIFKNKQTAEREAKAISGNPQVFNEKFTQKSSDWTPDSRLLPENEEARNVFGAAFLDSVFSLDLYKPSKVIEISQGDEKFYAVVMVTEQYEFKPLLSLDDSIFTPDAAGEISRQKVRDVLSAMLFQQKLQEEIIKDLRKNAVIKINNGKNGTPNNLQYVK